VRTITQSKVPMWVSTLGPVVLGLFFLGMTSCQSPHEPTRRTEPNLNPGWPQPNNFFTQVCYQEVRSSVPKLKDAEYVNDDEICQNCHGAYAKTIAENVHRGDGCESCHGPASRHVETRGKEPGLIFSFKAGDPAMRAEACLRCHEQQQCAEGARWRTSKHAHCGVTCVECHRGHYNVPPGTPTTTEPQAAVPLGDPKMVLTGYQADAGPKKDPAKANLPSLRGTSQHLGAVAPGVCLRCHGGMRALQEIAGPHQIGGPNGFNCTTCHDPHGQIRESSRKDLCLSCHNGAPTMAWHSSIHANNGVCCTDCHNPHPRSKVLNELVNMDHYQVKRPKRLAMSVQEPEACYKCHAKIYGLNAMPYHHPIKEGKMVCSDCHDPHGQYLDNLREETVNMVCYRCHAEKQGPFAFEHPPVTERCTICHEPHGTVAKDLLRKPVTFLCMQCHAGHATNTHGNPAADTTQSTRINAQRAFFTDCTHCHAQVHGSDHATVTGHGFFMR
jgi:DmsE family decaheme c-type cytochrome